MMLHVKYKIWVDRQIASVIHPHTKVPFGFQNKMKPEQIGQKNLTIGKKTAEMINSFIIVDINYSQQHICLDCGDLNMDIKRELLNYR